MTVNIEIFQNFVHLLSELSAYWGKQSALNFGDIELNFLYELKITLKTDYQKQNSLYSVWVRKIKNKDKYQNDGLKASHALA